MATVTGIEVNRGRVEIALDGTVALRIPKAHFGACPLREGDEIDPEAYVEKLAPIQFADAYESALTSLDRSARTAKQIADGLRRKGYVQGAVDAVIQRLRENRLIDDALYAQRMAESQTRRSVGLYAFKRKLRAKGISDDDAEEALQAFNDEQQQTACLEAARTLHRKYAALPSREARGKLSQALARRGFGWDAIQSAVEQIIDEFED